MGATPDTFLEEYIGTGLEERIISNSNIVILFYFIFQKSLLSMVSYSVSRRVKQVNLPAHEADKRGDKESIVVIYELDIANMMKFSGKEDLVIYRLASEGI